MHHELGATNGVIRAHGSKGAFVSKWTIDKKTLRVMHGEDLLPSAAKLWQWNVATKSYFAGATTAFDRLCSARPSGMEGVSTWESRHLGTHVTRW